MSYLSLISEGHIPEHIWNSEEWKKRQEEGAARREKIAAAREPERRAKAAGNAVIAPQPVSSQLQSAAQGAVLENNPFVQAFQEKTPGNFNALDVRSDSQKSFDRLQQIKKWESAGKNLKLSNGTDLGTVSAKDATKIANNPTLGAMTSDSNKNVSRYL